MKIQTEKISKGTRIFVRTDEKIALAVRDQNGERIYLPEGNGDNSTYYVEEIETLTRIEKGFVVVHHQEVQGIEVIN